MIAIDVMHTCGQGIVSHLLGNPLFEVVYEQIHKAQALAVSDVCVRIKEIYSELGTADNRLTSRRFRAPAARGW